MNYTLYIGNKNYSTWSMRPWVVMKYFDIPFAEKLADAFYAPLCLRLKNYHIQTSSTLAHYIETICHTKGIQAWINETLKEHSFVAMDEPYQLHR